MILILHVYDTYLEDGPTWCHGLPKVQTLSRILT